MKKNQPKHYTKSKKSKTAWTHKRKYLNHYRMLNFYVRHCMIVEKVHETISFN